MDKIYLDNAATTFPKPDCVSKAVFDYMTALGCNINRGCYSSAYEVEDVVFETRELLCRLFNGSSPKNVIFTANITQSLNMVIKGFLHSGDHVIVSSMEHNAVMRPLNQCGIAFSRLADISSLSMDSQRSCSPLTSDDHQNNSSLSKNDQRSFSEAMISELSGKLTPNTKAVIMTHASNVCGAVNPIREVGEFCFRHGLKFIVDCAQTAGILPIDMKEDHISALCFTGHKGLLGPQGIGGIVLEEGFGACLDPLISGGTGSFSHLEEVPKPLPDRFEAGTLNIPGIFGLHAALKWIEERGISSLYEHEIKLADLFVKLIKPLEEAGKIKVIGYAPLHTGVVSISTLTAPLSETAERLDSEYGIMTRVGLHCAPSAHKLLQTFPTGTIRFSFGAFNTEKDVKMAATALNELLA